MLIASPRRRRNAAAFRYKAGDSLLALNATMTRASTASYIDSNGVLQTASTGVARDNHYISGVRTLLLEGQRTNSFLNSGAPATHTSPSLGTGTYTLWMVGTGSIAVAGATATITGAGTATAGTPVTFTVTVAGTVTFTVTGSPTRAQCENGTFATSYIATAGSAVTRSADVLTFPFSAVPQVQTVYLAQIEQGTATLSGFQKALQIGGGGTAGQRVMNIRINGSSRYEVGHQNADGTGGVFSSVAPSPTIGQTDEIRTLLNADGSVQIGQSINAGAETLGTASAANALAASWSTPVIILRFSTDILALTSLKIALGVRDLATMRAL